MTKMKLTVGVSGIGARGEVVEPTPEQARMLKATGFGVAVDRDPADGVVIPPADDSPAQTAAKEGKAEMAPSRRTKKDGEV